jgi:adenine phosphoribosyltransferase
MQLLKNKIREIADFPKLGITYKDITPLLKDPKALKIAIEQLSSPFLTRKITAVVGMEARGFIFGSLVAFQLGVSFVPLRKPGKLPYAVRSVAYDLEYGSTTLEIHVDALTTDDCVLVVDDVLATGGTAKASCKLIESLGAKIKACAFIIELDSLKGRRKLKNYPLHSLLHY